MVADKLGTQYDYFAKKPLKMGFKKVQKILQEKPENIATVGDQIFTDVIGGNRCKMFTILVEPIAEKDILITRLKRPIENAIKKAHGINISNTDTLIYTKEESQKMAASQNATRKLLRTNPKRVDK